MASRLSVQVAFRNFQHVRRSVCLVALTCFLGASATTVKAQSYLENVGVPTFTTKLPVESGFINAANGNLHIEIPLGSFPQRNGSSDKIVMMYDSAIWEMDVVDGNWLPYNIENSHGGWRIALSRENGGFSYGSNYTGWCAAADYYYWVSYTPWIWTAPDGTQHSFPVSTVQPTYPGICGSWGQGTPSASGYASDGSGYYISITNYTNAQVLAPDGTLMNYSTVTGYPMEDSNGNYVPVPNTTYQGNPQVDTTTWFDTTERTVLTRQLTVNNLDYETDAVPNAQGSTSTYTVHWQSINVNTNFGQPGISEWTTGFPVLSELDLPDGTKYTFNYDSGTSPGYYGLLASMTLPTGDTIYYSFANHSDPYGNVYRWISGRTTPDGSWAYAPSDLSYCSLGYVNCQQTFTVTKPIVPPATSADQTVYTFTLNGGDWPTQVQYYDHAAGLLATTTQCFSFVSVTTSGTCSYSSTAASPATNVHLLVQTTTLPIPGGTNVSATTEYSWDSGDQGIYGEVTQIFEWNFGNSPPNTADRSTSISYLNNTTANILNRPTSVKVTNNGGGTVAQTLYTYDIYNYYGGSLTSVTASGHDPNYGTNITARGNVTLIENLVSGSTYLNSYRNFDTTGQVTFSYDPNTNKTSYGYVCQNAYPTTLTNTLNQITTLGYDCNTGLLTSVKDANNQTTSFSYDCISRPLSIGYPDGGQTAMTFNYSGGTPCSGSTGLTYIGETTTEKITSSQNFVTTDNTDGLGRVASTVITSDPDGQTTIATQYDSNGRIQSVSNPYRSTSDPTYGSTQSSYDGLDRAIKVTDQDNSAANTYFGSSVGSNGGASSQFCSGFGLGYPILSVDEAGKKHQTWTDAFGRSIETDEPDSSGNLTVATCYSYDLNNNLTQVVQGSETRSYGYDLLSRLTSKTDPETGTTYLYYTNASGSLCSGDPNAVCRRVGPATNQTNPAVMVTTNYSYDALNRLTQQTYSDSTPTITYLYDSTNCLGLPACYNTGRRTGMTDGSGSSSWVYGIMGHVATESHTINNVTKAFSYVNNLDGSLATITYPSGRTLTYTPGGAGRPTAVTDTTNSSNPIPYASSVHYAPFGALSSMMNGPSNILSTWWYNNRLQLCRMAVNSSGSAPQNCGDSTRSGNVFDFAYSFGAPSNNGNVTRITDYRANLASRSVNYVYDNLNRINQAYTDATSGSYCWAETFTIDRYGNLTGIGGKSDHPTCTQESLNLTATLQNRLSTGSSPDYGYDAAGNLTSTPAPENASFTYNAENQLTQASDFATAGYLYDGDGKRVAKTSAGTAYKLYWFGMNDTPLAESDGSGNITDEYIFLNGKRIARRVVLGQ